MRARLLWLVKVVVTAALLYVVFSRIPFSGVLAELGDAHLWLIGIALGFTVLVRGATGLRLKILTDWQGMSLSLRHILEISFVSTFYGLALPGTIAGGAIRWYRLSRPDGKPEHALVAIVFDRLIDTLTLVGVGLLFWLWEGPGARHWGVGLILLALGAGLGGLWLFVFARPGAELVWDRVAAFPLFARRRLRILREASECYHTLPGRIVLGLAGLSVFRHLAGILSSFLIALALGMQIPFVSLAWIRALMMILALLPVTIGGFGVREASALELLTPYGLDPAKITAWSLVLFFKALAPALIGGLLEAWRTATEPRGQGAGVPP